MWQVRTAGRDAALQAFVDRAEEAVAAAARTPDAERASRKVFAALRRRSGPAGTPEPHRLEVCRLFGPALAISSVHGDLRRALAALEPRFAWSRRKNADPANPGFYDGHANVTIFGPGGLEERRDVWIGATLLAPDVRYIDHDHPPEEVYLPLSPGEWWNEDMDWTDPGLDGTIYNRPGIRHAMRSGATPFLALWFLPAE